MQPRVSPCVPSVTFDLLFHILHKTLRHSSLRHRRSPFRQNRHFSTIMVKPDAEDSPYV